MLYGGSIWFDEPKRKELQMNMKKIILKEFQKGTIKQLGPRTYTIPSRLFVLGITPSDVVKVLESEERGEADGLHRK